jgi:hemerythrin-like domain-containing protein
MLRDPSLAPLSRQHQHALALCVRIDRAPRSTVQENAAWQKEIVRLYEQEIRFHFDAEERVLFPAAARFTELCPLVDVLRGEHVGLRAEVAAAAEGNMTGPELQDFAAHLSAHVRREERELFEGMQKLFSAEELARLGAAVDADFAASGLPSDSCDLNR